MVKRAHEVGAVVVLDACQSVPHLKIDLHALDVDFAAWSAHKMYGPTGVGFLYGKRDMLEALPPANFGGSMVELAWMDQEAQYMAPPARFEAGTQPVAQVVAAGVAAEWLMNIGMENLEAHERVIAGELLKMGRSTACAFSDRRPTSSASARWLLKSTACIRMMLDSSSMRRASPFVSDIIAHSRSTVTSACTHPTAHPVASTIPSKTRRHWLRR